MLNWTNLIGHATTVAYLKKNIADEKFPHAVIFSGEEGVGKRLAAEICAAAMVPIDDERLTEQINQLSGEMERLRQENATLKAENQELRREVDRLNSQALFRNTNRARDGKFAPRETKSEKK